MTQPESDPRFALETEWTAAERLLALFGFTGLAISQPLLVLFGLNPELFTFNRVVGWSLVWVAVCVVVVPPLLLWGIDILASRRSSRAARLLHPAMIWFLAVLFPIPIVKLAYGVTSPVLVAILAVIVASVLIALYLYWKPMAMLFRTLAILPFLVAGLFLFTSESSELLTMQQEIPEISVVSGDPADTPVVLVVLDELPTKSLLDDDLTIDRKLYPHLADFADEATWYRNFTTNATLTLRAVPSLLAGVDGDKSKALWSEYPDNVFSVLAPTHDLHVSEVVSQLCGQPECLQSPDYRRFTEQAIATYGKMVSLTTSERSFGDFEERISETDDHGELVAVPDRFSDFLDTFEEPQAGERPDLHFLHLILPHQPWRYFGDGQAYHTDEESATFPAVSRHNDDGAWVASVTEQRHLYQASYSDRLVGEMISRLHDIDLYDDALVIVVSDHGISFELDTQIRETTSETLDSLVFSPLLIKYPNQNAGLIDDSNVMAIDLLPTIAETLGLAVPETVQGVAIGSAAQRERGELKHVLDVVDDGTQRVQGTIEYEASAHFPNPSERWIVPGAGETALAAIAGIEEFLGVSVDTLEPQSAGGVSIESLGNHELPGSIAEAMVVGRANGIAEGTILIAVDDVVVTGSPIYEFDDTPGSFAAMVPQELTTQPKLLRILHVDGELIFELEISR